MANPTFQPILSESNYSPTPISKKLGGYSKTLEPGPSGLDQLAALAKLGVQAYDVYDKYKLSKVQENVRRDTEALVNEAQMGSPSIYGDKAQEVRTDISDSIIDQANAGQIPAFESEEEMRSFNSQYSKIEDGYKQKQDWLLKAKDQGRISELEFREKNLAITKQYLAANPGYRTEILQTASNVLQDSGIIARLQRDDAMISEGNKQAQAARDKLEQEAKERDVDLTNHRDPEGGINYGSLSNEINKRRENAYFASELKRLNDTNEQLDKAQVTDLVRGGIHLKAMDGLFANLQSSFNTMFSGESGKYASEVVAAADAVSVYKRNLRSMFSAYLNIPEIEKQVQFYETQADDLIARMKSYGSQEELKSFLTNQNTITRQSQELGLATVVNLPAINAIASLVSASGGLAGLTAEGKTGLVLQLTKLTDDAIKGVQSLDSESYSLTNPKDPANNKSVSTGKTLLDNVMKQVQKDIPGSIPLMNNVTSAFLNGITDFTTVPNPTDAFRSMDDAISIISEDTNKKVALSLDETNQSKYLNTIGDYSDSILKEFYSFASSYDGDIEFTINDSTGSLVVTGIKDGTVNKEIQDKYVARMNRSLKAYANINGISSKEASPAFFSTYYEPLFNIEARPITNNPINVLDSNGRNIKQFATKEEGIIAGANQVLEAYKGSSTVPPATNIATLIKRLRPIDNTNQELAQSQQTIIEAVAKQMDLSPRTPLELQNPRVLSQFISALAQTEGNSLIWEEVADIVDKKVISFDKKTGPKLILNPLLSELNIDINKLPEITEKDKEEILTSSDIQKEMYQNAKAILADKKLAANLGFGSEEYDSLMNAIEGPSLENVYPEILLVPAFSKLLKVLRFGGPTIKKATKPMGPQPTGPASYTPKTQRQLATEQAAKKTKKKEIDGADISGVLKSNPKRKTPLKLEGE